VITADIFNGARRVSHGLLMFWQRRETSQAAGAHTWSLSNPVPFVNASRLRHGGATNVPTNAASYWATLPMVNLPDTGLSPHYLEDFILHPPTNAA
jgi:hypothetical protein